ncbi:MAG TPA: CPBP family intramembrane glutamic endopeptidase, partial [Armatimonadota bacterium]|nr:CPBP family intramembrane glutamic endopeptidase [Armatimonadota bacterium]
MFPVPVDCHILLYLFSGLCLATVLCMWLGKLSLVEAGWCWGGWRALVLIVGWGGLLSVAGVSWLRFLIHTGRYLPIPITPTARDWLVLIIIAPVLEEVFFRGAILGIMQRSWHPFWAVVITAVFSMVCFPMQLWVAFIFFCSLGYGIIFCRSRSVIAAIVVHAVVAAVL